MHALLQSLPRMGVPTGAAAHRLANTSCRTRMREDNFIVQAALVSTSALETRLMREGCMLHILLGVYLLSSSLVQRYFRHVGDLCGGGECTWRELNPHPQEARAGDEFVPLGFCTPCVYRPDGRCVQPAVGRVKVHVVF